MRCSVFLASKYRARTSRSTPVSLRAAQNAGPPKALPERAPPP